MFFAFQILMIIVLTFGQVNSSVIRDKSKTKVFIHSTSTQENWKIEDDAPKNITSFKTHIPLYQIIKNLTKSKSHNLKSNVFDKMLSDEMLSIKQHFYEQDKKTSTLTMNSQTNVPTPTLEIKQRWPIIEALQHLRIENSSKDNVTFNDGNHLNENEKDEKVLELRSLPEVTPHSAHPVYLYHEKKMCTCKNADVTCATNAESSTICTEANRESINCQDSSNIQENAHVCTQSFSYLCSHMQCTHKQCTHKQCTHKQCTHMQCTHKQCTHKECTRDQTLYSTAFYVTYQPFFIGITQPSNVLYYHPDVVNELKFTKKTKLRKTTTSYKIEDLYYNEDESSESSEEDLIDDDKPRQPLKHYVEETDNEDGGNSAPSVKTNIEDNHGLIKEKVINEIVNDLKLYYRDSVIRDCFCSFMTSSSTLNSFSLYNLTLGLLIFAL